LDEDSGPKNSNFGFVTLANAVYRESRDGSVVDALIDIGRRVLDANDGVNMEKNKAVNKPYILRITQRVPLDE